MGLFDRHRLPADARAGLAAHLATDDGRGDPRVLAWCATPEGFLVGLPDRLAFDAGGTWTSLPWERLLSAAWDDGGSVFLWRTVERPFQLNSQAVSDPRTLPEVVRERLERTIVARTEVVLAPGVLATLVGRRPATGDGAITWSVLPPRGIRLDTPELAAAADRAVRAAERDLA